MVKKNVTTLELSGEATVRFDKTYDYFWVSNLGNADVLVSMDSGITDNADGVIIVPSGCSCSTMHGRGADTLYLKGSGKVQVMGTYSAFNPFKRSAKGGEIRTASGTDIVIDGALFPIIKLNVYGKTVQNTEPSTDTPAEMLSAADNGILSIITTDGIESLTAEFTSGMPMYGIAVDGVGNYIDPNGQHWICDELIVNADGSGKLVKRCGHAFVTAANITAMTENASFGNFFYTNIVGAVGTDENSVKPLSNRFLGVPFGQRAIAEHVNKFRCFLSQDGRLILRNSAADNRFTSVAQMQEFVTENETAVIYPLAEASEIGLTAQETEAFRKLRIFNGTTRISNSAEADMTVKYLASKAVSEAVLPIITSLGG